MFVAEFETVSPAGRRHAPRAPVALDARIGKAGRAVCTIVDISIQGARLQTYSSLAPGSTIWLTLPGEPSIVADVMWADDFSAGCRFQVPLDEALLARLIALDL